MLSRLGIQNADLRSRLWVALFELPRLSGSGGGGGGGGGATRPGATGGFEFPGSSLWQGDSDSLGAATGAFAAKPAAFRCATSGGTKFGDGDGGGETGAPAADGGAFGAKPGVKVTPVKVTLSSGVGTGAGAGAAGALSGAASSGAKPTGEGSGAGVGSLGAAGFSPVTRAAFLRPSPTEFPDPTDGFSPGPAGRGCPPSPGTFAGGDIPATTSGQPLLAQHFAQHFTQPLHAQRLSETAIAADVFAETADTPSAGFGAGVAGGFGAKPASAPGSPGLAALFKG